MPWFWCWDNMLDELAGRATQCEVSVPVSPVQCERVRRSILLRSIFHIAAIHRAILPILALNVRVTDLLACNNGIRVTMEVARPTFFKHTVQAHNVPARKVHEHAYLTVLQPLCFTWPNSMIVTVAISAHTVKALAIKPCVPGCTQWVLKAEPAAAGSFTYAVQHLEVCALAWPIVSSVLKNADSLAGNITTCQLLRPTFKAPGLMA